MATIADAHKSKIFVGIACHAFHHPTIMIPLSQKLASHPVTSHRLELLSMVEITVRHITTKFTPDTKIGLLLSEGSKVLRLYHNPLTEKGFCNLIDTTDEEQQEVTESILKVKEGKSKEVESKLWKVVERFHLSGVSTILLGCTELPVVINTTSFKGTEIIDPMRLVAVELVTKASTILKFL